MSSSNKRSRARRVLGVLGSVVGVTVTFVVGLTAATVIHLDMPATRRLVASQANAILKSTLKGEVHVDHIGHIGLDGASGIRVRVKDPEGVQVLDVTGVHAKTNGLAIARSALFDKGPIVIPVHLAKIDNVDANLDTDGTKEENLRIANAFMPRDESPSDPTPGRGVRVDAPDIRIGHVWAHGYPPGGQPVDADIHGLLAKGHLDPQRLDVELVRVALQARAIPRGLDPNGVVSGRFAMPMEGDKPPMAIEAKFDGKIGNIPTNARASMNGSRIDAVVDAHDATGSDTQAIVSEVAIHDALTLHAEAHGDLPRIEGKANVALGQATASATAVVVTGAATKIQANVAVRNFNARSLLPTAPKTELGLDATADISIADEGVSGTAAVDTLPSLVNDQKVPPINVRAKLAGKSAEATATISDKDMKAKVHVVMTPRTDRADGQIITAEVESKIPDLHRLPEVGTMVGGSAEIEASAKLTMPEKAIDAKAKVTATKVRETHLALGKVTTEAKVGGTLDRPVIDADVKARELLTGTLPLAKLDATARIIVEGSSVSISNFRAEATRPLSESIVVVARLVKVEGSNLRVDGAKITGVGEPIAADVVKSGNDIDGTIDAPKIDLPLLARLVGKEEELAIKSGTLAVKAKGALHSGDVRAGMHAELKNLEMRDVKQANATVDATVDGRDVRLDLAANVGDTGNLTVKSDQIVLAGPAADPNAWKKAHGKLDVDGQVDLSKVISFVPPEKLPLGDLRGFVTFQGRVGRDREGAPPELQLHAHTTGLIVAGKPETAPAAIGGIRVEGVAPWRASGIEVGLDVRNDATSGLTQVAFRATDSHGMLVAFDSKTFLPYAELVDHPEVAKDRAFAAPISARLVVPPRRLEDLPPILNLKDTGGAIEVELEAGGTILDPNVRLIARGRGLRTPQMPKAAKTDADIAVDYDGKEAKLAVRTSADGADLLSASSTVKIASRDFLVGTPNGAAPEWTASAKAHLAAFPLETVPPLANQHVKGSLSGDVELTDLHKDARVVGHLVIDKLKVGRVEYEKGNIDVEAGRGKLAAKVRIDQKDGFIDASASSGMTWGAALAPTLDEKSPLEAKLQAKNFSAAAIQPFVASAVPTLDGRIEANASARFIPGRPGAVLDC